MSHIVLHNNGNRNIEYEPGKFLKKKTAQRLPKEIALKIKKLYPEEVNTPTDYLTDGDAEELEGDALAHLEEIKKEREALAAERAEFEAMKAAERKTSEEAEAKRPARGRPSAAKKDDSFESNVA